MVKWWARITAAVTGAVITLMIPAYAWAAGNGTLEAARYRRGRGFFYFGGAVCCLLVVTAVVVAVILISRKRKRR